MLRTRAVDQVRALQQGRSQEQTDQRDTSLNSVLVDSGTVRETSNLLDGDAPVRALSLNRAQIIAGYSMRYIKAAGLVVVCAASYVDADAPEVPALADYVVTGVALQVAWDATAAVNALARREAPFNYLRNVGNGSVVRGMLKEGGKKVMSTIDPATFVFVLGGARWALWTLGNLDGDTYGDMVMLLFYMNTPLAKTLILSAPVLLKYVTQQDYYELKWKWPEPPAAENYPHVRWYQHGLSFANIVVSSVLLCELAKEVFNTLGPAYANHIFYVEYMVLPLAAGVEVVEYLADTTQPFKKLEAPCATAPQPAEEDGEVEDAEKYRVRHSTKKQQFLSVSTKIAIFVAAAGAVGVATRLIANGASDPNNPDSHDPATWKAWERVGVEALMVVGYEVLKTGLSNIQYVPQLFRHTVSAVSSCLGFFRRNEQVSVPMTEINVAGAPGLNRRADYTEI